MLTDPVSANSGPVKSMQQLELLQNLERIEKIKMSSAIKLPIKAIHESFMLVSEKAAIAK